MEKAAPSTDPSSYSSASSSNSSGQTRHQSRTRSRRSSCSSRRSSHKDLARKHIKDEHSRSRKERSSSKKRKHRSDSEVFTTIDQGRSRKRRRKRRAENEVDDFEKPSYFESKKEACQKSTDRGDDMPAKQRSNNRLQVMMDMQEQQKAVIRRNAEIAKARLESGDLQKAREEQVKMHRLYGTVDWRLKKKLRTEKRVLERTVAAGKKLATLEEQEHARMDAFRVALGLPTAEAQRQAEWRAEATQELIEMESRSKHAATAENGFRSSKRALIGPSLPP